MAAWKVPDYFGAVIPLGHSGLPLDAQAWQVFENFVHSLGLTEIGNISYFAVVQAWRPGVTPPASVPPFTNPPAPPEKPWYETVAVGARLKIIRAEGLNVYTDSTLSATWSRGRLAVGNTSMTIAAAYDAALDKTPPAGVLCVLRPTFVFMDGLWIVSIGNDGQPNVEIVT